MPSKHTVQQGECLSSIARAYGFDDWRIIYNYPDNADFKKKHPNPNLIFPGEELVIPDLDAGGASGATEKKHPFVLKLDVAYTLQRTSYTQDYRPVQCPWGHQR